MTDRDAGLLDKPFTRNDAHRLFADRLLSPRARDFALDALHSRPDWWSWADRSLLCLGFALLLSGIVFFFAHNWDEMGRFARLGVVEVGLLAAFAGAARVGSERLLGRLLLLSSNILLGVFLAVFGQVYQTGADAADLFVSWAAVGSVLAFSSRFAAHWMLWLVVADLGLSLTWVQHFEASLEGLYLIQTLYWCFALVGREFLVRRNKEWARGAWTRLVLLTLFLSAASRGPLMVILDDLIMHFKADTLAYVCTGIWILGSAGAVLYYRVRERDVAALTLVCLTACTVLLTLAGRLLFENVDALALEFLLFSLLVLGAFSSAAAWLRKVHREVGFPPLHGPVVSRAEMLARLADRKLYDTARDRLVLKSLAKPDPRMPGYLHAFLGLGAWVAAGFFTAFLWEAEVIKNTAQSLAPTGILLILLATGARHFSNSVFLSAPCLAVSMAGNALLLAGVYKGTHEDHGLAWVTAASAAVGAGLYPILRDPAQRFIGVVTPILLAIATLIDERMYSWIHALLLVEAAAIGIVLSRPHSRPALKPLLYGLSVGLLITAGSFAGEIWNRGTSDTWSRITATAGLICVIVMARRLYRLAGEGAPKLGEPGTTAVVSAVPLGALSSPAVTGALSLGIAGIARGDRVLVRLCQITFPLFLYVHYYSLDMTLLTKSLLLMGSGLVLLGARAWSQRRPWARGAEA